MVRLQFTVVGSGYQPQSIQEEIASERTRVEPDGKPVIATKKEPKESSLMEVGWYHPRTGIPTLLQEVTFLIKSRRLI